VGAALHDLVTYKLPPWPAGFDVSRAQIVLAARSGFTPRLVDAAGSRDVLLLDVATLTAELGR